MSKTMVVIIGGGATGTGILRDLSMRGIKAVLIEQRDIAHGASSHFHGLLHSGGRYAVKDPQSARECIAENAILRRIAKFCVEETEGFFIRTPGDGEAFERQWVEACGDLGIPAQPVSVQEARRLEPGLTSGALAVYRVPDAAIDGFRLCWQNVASARTYGGEVRTYSEVITIHQDGSRVSGVTIKNSISGESESISCDFIVNAAGSWVGKVAHLAGINLPIKPDRGTLVAFNHRFTNRVFNRLRSPSDGDIFVPHGSITILGTTSVTTDEPDDTRPRTTEALELLKIGSEMVEDLGSYRLLRVFTGTRPLYCRGADKGGREITRGYAILDHEADGLKGFVSIVGGKLTTYRLMAEKVSDWVCEKTGNQSVCQTAEEPLLTEPSPELMEKAQVFFPAYGARLAAGRLGVDFASVVDQMQQHPEKKELICECELVTQAEVEMVAADTTSCNLNDIRRRTRMGMGTCQGAFCGLRAIGVVASEHLIPGKDVTDLLTEFLEARWHGIRPILWGNQLREVELQRGIYQALLNVDGAKCDVGK